MSETDGNPPEVYKVIGAPGTGKTTRVVGNPELDLDGLFIENLQRYKIDDQMIVTYTNAGVDEAADRLYKMLDGKNGRPSAPKYKIEDRVTTIHGQCFRILGLDREQVVQHWHKKNYCDAFGLEFGYDDDDDDIMAGDMDEGNALFRIYGWLQSNRKDLSEWEDCPAEWDWEEDPEWLMEKWEDFKEGKNLIGFGDMIENVVEMGYTQLKNLGWGVLFPDEDTTTREMFKEARHDPQRDPDIIRGKGAFVDTRVLYVDEVQDLTPLQWEWYLLQKLVAEEVYIGGDDDQTIYGWAGANPNFMLEEEGDFEVLDKTYRIPEEIWEVCDGVINQVDVRQEKDVTPHGDGGEFHALRRPGPRKLMNYLEEGECMVLFRARYQIDEFREELHTYGIPYRNMSTFDTWSDDIVKLRDALAKLDNGDEKLLGDEVEVMMEYAEDRMLKTDSGVSKSEMVMGQLGGVTRERLNEIFELSSGYTTQKLTAENYLNATDEVNWYEQQAILGNIRNGNEHMMPDRVRIGTIHSSKGKEAPTVMVCTDSTKTILENMNEEVMKNKSADERYRMNGVPMTDAERRVYYVGMTRASDTLVLAEGVIDPETVIPLESILPEEFDESRIEGVRKQRRGW